MKIWLVVLPIILNQPIIAFCETNDKVCSTPVCTEVAKEISSSLDESVNPCDNFYNFACGNAIQKMVIPSDNIRADMFEIVRDELNERLKTVFSEPIAGNETEPISLVKSYYQACMNEERIEDQGIPTLKSLLKQLGGWPVLEGDSWKGTNFSWPDLLVKFRKLGFGITYFTEMTVDLNPRNSSSYIIELDQLVPGLQRDLLIDRSKVRPYLDLMTNISVELGADKARARKELNESLEFEINLVKFALSVEERHDVTKLLNYMSIKEFQEKYPKTPWLKYMNGLLSSGVHLKENDTILIVVPSYFSSMEELIQKTSKRIQANYAIWRAIQDLLMYLPKNIYRHLQNAVALLDGQLERPARWKECTKNTYKTLPILAGSLYVRKFFDEDAKRNTIEMVRYIKDGFVNILKNSEWMDSETKQKALNKVYRIEDRIGYPKELLNDTLLREHFKALVLNKDDYLKSTLNITIYRTDNAFKKLHSAVSSKTDWTKYDEVANVGASYSILENSIDLPAGILQGAFFNKNRPNYMNFGAIGSVIAHEVTHGFDDIGKNFDENGNVANWWANETETKFKNKANCMINQYGNYTIAQIGRKVNGLRTIDENIADNGGVKEAYLAYQAWAKFNGTEPKLPGLKYSPNQLFWISAARNWCAKQKDSFLETVAQFDKHSPNEFRVIGPFSNSEDFANDFQCRKGSKMNPVHKCAVW